MAARIPQPTSAPSPRDQGPRAIPRLQTATNNDSASRKNRYSYMDTPVETQRPVFQEFSSPTNSTIDESPISPASSTRGLPGYDHQNTRGTPLPEEKALEAQLQAPPVQGHPAFATPSRREERERMTPMNHSATGYNVNLNPPPSPGPIPIKSHDSRAAVNLPQSPGPIPTKSHHNGTASTIPLTQYTTLPAPNSGTGRREIYNPDSLQGPNIVPPEHKPGQVSHPNAAIEPHWKHGLCEPDALCCVGLFCPCMLYGKTMYRLSRKAQKQDPTDLLGYESCNGSCGMFAVACGIQGKMRRPHLPSPPLAWNPPCARARTNTWRTPGILAAIHRTRIRRFYKIDGTFGTDCLKSVCCCCCVVAQNEREVRDREELIRRHAGPVSGAYISPNPGLMSYAPPPR